MSHLRRLELFSVVYPALPGWAKCVPRLGRLSEADGNRAGREASGTKGEGDVEKERCHGLRQACAICAAQLLGAQASSSRAASRRAPMLLKGNFKGAGETPAVRT